MEIVWTLIGLGGLVAGVWLLVRFAQYRMDASINDIE